MPICWNDNETEAVQVMLRVKNFHEVLILMSDYDKFLKGCSKDKESFTKLKKLVDELKQEKNQAENRLKLLERAIKSDYDSILITTLDLEKPGPKIVYVNDGFTRMTGYSRDEAIGKTPRILQGEKTDRAVLDTLKKRLKEGQAFFGHTVNYRKDGSEFINQWDIHPLTDEQGEITHWVSYQHDITERKRSEKKVLDSQLEFDSLAEESKKTLIDIDEQGNIVTSNKAFRDLIGFDDEELKKKKIWELLEDELVENFKHRFDNFKPSDFDGRTYNLALQNKKSKSVEVNVSTRLLRIDDQNIVRAAFENKSLQKRIMAMLSQQGDKLDKSFDSVDFRYKLKADGEDFTFIYVSDNCEKITGLSSDDAENTSISDLIHPDDITKVHNHLKNVLDGKPNTEQYRVISADGGHVKIIDYAKPVWDSKNENVSEIKGSISTKISSANKATKT